MARYRLHDLDLILRRGLAVVALGLITIGAYAADARDPARAWSDDLDLPEAVLGFLAALVTAAALPDAASLGA